MAPTTSSSRGVRLRDSFPDDSVGYDVKCDVWSMGVILYIMLCGFPPFYNENLPKLFEHIMKKPHDFPSPEWDPISAEGKDLIVSTPPIPSEIHHL